MSIQCSRAELWQMIACDASHMQHNPNIPDDEAVHIAKRIIRRAAIILDALEPDLSKRPDVVHLDPDAIVFA